MQKAKIVLFVVLGFIATFAANISETFANQVRTDVVIQSLKEGTNVAAEYTSGLPDVLFVVFTVVAICCFIYAGFLFFRDLIKNIKKD